jgi:hypothetical protein
MIRMIRIEFLHQQRRLQKKFLNMLLMPLFRQEYEFNQIYLDLLLLRLFLLLQSLQRRSLLRRRRRNLLLHWWILVVLIRVVIIIKAKRKEDGLLLKKKTPSVSVTTSTSVPTGNPTFPMNGMFIDTFSLCIYFCICRAYWSSNLISFFIHPSHFNYFLLHFSTRIIIRFCTHSWSRYVHHEQPIVPPLCTKYCNPKCRLFRHEVRLFFITLF